MDYDEEGFVPAEDGTRLFYGVRGDGPVLVLNDGIGCDGFAWRYLMPYFAQRHRVIHWHYRGHGRSGPPQDPSRLDIPSLARDLQAVLDAVGVEQAVLLGHSMGTQVELEFVRLEPDRVRGLVFLCGTYGRVTDTFHGTDLLKRVLPSVIEAASHKRGLARALWSRVPSKLAYRVAKWSGEVDGSTIIEEDFRQYWSHVGVMDPHTFLVMLRLAGEHSAYDMLPRIKTPSLVVAAEKDTFTPPALAQELAVGIPGCEFFLVRGASHAAPVEQPVVIQLRIEEFLRRIE